jgi:hypothetical protein
VSAAAALAGLDQQMPDASFFGDALASYDRALGVRPDYVEALTNRGVTRNAL